MTMQATEFERRAAIARGAVPGDFGEGWMTTGARDMVRIAAFAGFDIPTLVKRVALATKHDGYTGPRLVERVMGEMTDEYDAAHPDSAASAARTEQDPRSTP